MFHELYFAGWLRVQWVRKGKNIVPTCHILKAQRCQRRCHGRAMVNGSVWLQYRMKRYSPVVALRAQVVKEFLMLRN